MNATCWGRVFMLTRAANDEGNGVGVVIRMHATRQMAVTSYTVCPWYLRTVPLAAIGTVIEMVISVNAKENFGDVIQICCSSTTTA